VGDRTKRATVNQPSVSDGRGRRPKVLRGVVRPGTVINDARRWVVDAAVVEKGGGRMLESIERF
jgi:hypothetical protein